MRLLSFLLVASLANAFQGFPAERDIQMVNWFVNVSKSLHLPALSKLPRVDFERLEQSVDEWAELAARVAADPEALRLIRSIYEKFQTQDGVYLRQMLVLAARDRSEREAFLRGMKYEKGLICWPGFDLIGEKIWYGSPKVSFGSTQLKADIDTLEKHLFPDAGPPEWLRNLDVRDLDVYEPYFKLFLEMEPKTRELLEFLIHYAQFLTCQFSLQGFFQSLNSWLLDRNNGLASILAGAKPRTAH